MQRASCFNLSVALLVVLQAVPAAPGQSRQTGGGGGPPATARHTVMRVVPLAHTEANGIASVVSKAFDGAVGIAVDARTNSLIVSVAEESAIDPVLKLITQLDVAVSNRQPDSSVVEFFPVPGVRGDAAMQLLNAATSLVSRDTRVSLAAQSLLVARGEREDLMRVRELVARLDAEQPARSGSVTLSFYVLSAADESGKGNLPDALTGVGAALSENGFLAMSLLAPLQIDASLAGPGFELRGRAAEQTEVQIKGALSGDGANLQLKIDSSVATTSGTTRATLLDITTTINVRMGEFVVLAAAPAGGTPFKSMALVVRVTPAAK